MLVTESDLDLACLHLKIIDGRGVTCIYLAFKHLRRLEKDVCMFKNDTSISHGVLP